MKLTFRLPRPYWVNPDVASIATPAAGYGLPSGHSQTPLSIFGLMATTIKNVWFTALVIFTVFLIGLSRVYLGEHFFFDVLAGWLLGALILWAFIKLEDRVQSWFAEKSNIAKIGSAFAISLVLILIAAIILAIPSDYVIPPEWLANAQSAYPEETIEPFTISNVITSAATLFGLAVGVVWTRAGGGFDANTGKWWQRFARFIIGVLGVLVFWMGLDLIFPDNNDFISYLLRYIRYTLVGLWIVGGSPWVFIRLKLGKQEH
jgi:hypothetical protein